MAILVLIGVELSGEDCESRTDYEIQQYITKMQAVYDTVESYTCTFYKQERIDGELLPRETIVLKFRKPFSIYMKWIDERHKGQEAIYVKGRYNGKMIAHKGDFPDITMRVNPEGVLAMRRNRHPITEAGIGETIQDLVDDFERASEHPEDSVRYTDLGTRKEYGECSHCFKVRVPGRVQSKYYAPFSEICISVNSFLPVSLTIRNSQGQLIEKYGYTDLKLNPELTQHHFDPENPAYDF